MGLQDPARGRVGEASGTQGHHTVAEIGGLPLAVGNHMVLSRGLTSSDLGSERISGSSVDLRGRSRGYCGNPFRDSGGLDRGGSDLIGKEVIHS